MCGTKCIGSSSSGPGLGASDVIIDLQPPTEDTQSDSYSLETPVRECHATSSQIQPYSTSTALNCESTPLSTTNSNNACYDILQSSVNTPLSMIEERVATHLLRRKMNNCKDKVVRFKTRGQPIVFQRITKCRKPSQYASSPTKKKRSMLKKRISHVVAGTSAKDTEAQYTSDLKRQRIGAKRKLFENCGLVGKVHISAKYSLAMKEAMGLTWHQDRLGRRCLKKIGISIQNEKSMRDIGKNIIGESVCSTTITVTDPNDGTSSQEPVAIVPSLHSFVLTLLDGYHESGQLTWHDNGIPSNQIWVKVGGDHGRGSMKICTQIANLVNPNAKEHTHMVALVEEKDSYEVLQGLLSNLNSDISLLQTSTWDNKEILTFLFGDYAFFCKLYGLSGATGKYPCIWCLISSDEMKRSKKNTKRSRTLAMLERENRRYNNQGGSAMEHHNCVRAPLIDIEPDQVVPPYLHILLGLVWNHHVMLLEATQEIDELIASNFPESSKLSFETTREFDAFVEAQERTTILNNRINQLVDAPNTEQRNRKVNSYRKEITNLEKTVLPDGTGPLSRSMDKKLKEIGIDRGVYHGGNFVGNHCHIYLHKHKEITKHVFQHTVKLTNGLNLDASDHALVVQEQFNLINQTYLDIHTEISHSRRVPKEKLKGIKQNISYYMSIQRNQFKHVTPKMHMLEHHCLPFIHKWGFGLGLMGEQGGESLHSSFSLAERKTANVRNKSERLKHAVKCHRLQVSTELRSLIPEVKKRNTKQ